MFKKILVGTLLASAVSVASASTAPYVGAGLGILNNTSDSVTFRNSSLDGFYRGVPVNVFAGYGGVINQNFYLAGELTGTVGTFELTGMNSVKTSYGLGVSVLPGIMLSDHTLAFARAGVVRTRFSKVDKFANGGQVGLGLQTSLTQNVDVRGEYDFTAYKTVGNIGSPRQDSTTVSLIYKLD